MSNIEPPAAHPAGQAEEQLPARLSPDGFLRDAGARAGVRCEPRLGVTLAGVGIAMMVVGVITWPGDETDPMLPATASGVAEATG